MGWVSIVLTRQHLQALQTEKLVAMESSMSKLYFCTSRKGVING